MPHISWMIITVTSYAKLIKNTHRMTWSSSCITHDNSNSILPETTFLIAGLRVTVTPNFPGLSVM